MKRFPLSLGKHDINYLNRYLESVLEHVLQAAMALLTAAIEKNIQTGEDMSAACWCFSHTFTSTTSKHKAVSQI